MGRGQEHLVRFATDSQRVVKFTVPGRGGYGLTPYVKSASEIGLRPGTPSEYLQRLAWQNQIFGDDFRFEGLAARSNGAYDLVVSQSVIKADPSGPKPTAAEIERYFQARGFAPVAGQEGKTYYRAIDNLAVFDAHEGNLIRTFGGLLPIDLIVVQPDDSLLQVLERGLEGPS